MTEEFRKYHALGNDYIVIDPREFPFIPEPAAVLAICDRNMGPGSDGILLGPLAAADDLDGLCAGPVGQGIVPWVRIFNPDGSEAEKSGNGLRIFCLYLAEQGYVDREEFHVGTKGGIVSARVMNLDPPLIKVDMGEPSFSAGKARLRTDLPEFIQGELKLEGESLLASFVSMGNPHCVVFIDEPTSDMARRFGPLIENNPLFPERTNVQFAKVIDRHTLRIEIWERGAGYTLASGSSSCAAASVARRLGLVEGLVQVQMPGGTISLDLSAPSILMTGPALCIYSGRFSDSMIDTLAAAGSLPSSNPRVRSRTI
ncbi:MAG TPA: diaminopimelate epimerase [Spirochaetaceae bacterium]|nr:diaminopimelate epimerase [Spirochaetaceae bacterium]